MMQVMLFLNVSCFSLLDACYLSNYLKSVQGCGFRLTSDSTLSFFFLLQKKKTTNIQVIQFLCGYD